jgi:hypothetical protein
VKNKKQVKTQLVFKKDGRSYTRHAQDGKIRSLDCKHGVTCRKCFVEIP